MFRRQGGFEWSERMVLACAQRQEGILETAAALVRPGGYLLYATCTFSPEENEGVIGSFLAEQPEFDLTQVPQVAGFAPGHPEWSLDHPNPKLSRTVRLWPHRFAGEGHFLALLQRQAGTADRELPRLKDFTIRQPSRAELALWLDFAQDTLALDLPKDRLHAAGGRLYLLPERHPDSGGLRLVRYGVPLGELRAGYFRPAADLALALDRTGVKDSVSWAAEVDRLQAYIAGEDVEDSGPNGWVLVCVERFGLGWAKRVNGRLKNHYPRHARRPRTT